MAKLSGVKVIDMVGGEITMVEYDGAVYEKVEGPANIGDLTLITDDSWLDATEGEFYLAVELSDNDPRIVDDGGDKDSNYSGSYALFRNKVSAPKGWKKGDKVRCKHSGEIVEVFAYKPEKRTVGSGEGSKFNGHEKGFTYIDEDGFERWEHIKWYEPVTETKPKTVKRKARVGERIMITDAGYAGIPPIYKDGDILTVVDDDFIGGVKIAEKEEAPYIDHHEYKVIIEEKESEPTHSFSVGDRVKALAYGEDCDIEVGEIGTVDDIHIDEDDPYTIGVKSDDGDYDYFNPEDLELVDDKPKFEIGDYVVALPEADDQYAITNTDMKLGKVVGVGEEIRVEIVKHENDRCVGRKYDVKSKYFRKATKEEVAEATKPVLKVGDFVRVIDQPGHYQNETIVEIVDDNYSKVWPFETRNLDGSIGDIHSAEQLVKVTDEEKAEYEKATKFAKLGRKPGEFRKGDIVRCNQETGADVEGSFVMIAADGADRYVGVDGDIYLGDAKWFDLIAPVESRLDND